MLRRGDIEAWAAKAQMLKPGRGWHKQLLWDLVTSKEGANMLCRLNQCNDTVEVGVALEGPFACELRERPAWDLSS